MTSQTMGNATSKAPSDRELLEAAARAAGYSSWDFLGWAQDGRMNVYDAQGRQENWNPLTDDGDALRLAVKLAIHIEFVKKPHGTEASYVQASPMGSGHLGWTAVFGEDRAADVRRAIVCAAAAIALAPPSTGS